MSREANQDGPTLLKDSVCFCPENFATFLKQYEQKKTNKKVFQLPSAFSAFSSEFYNTMLACESLCRIALPPQLP